MTLQVEEASGGTLFIDEAALFRPAPAGSAANPSNHVLDHLLKVSGAPLGRRRPSPTNTHTRTLL